jgi:hypothetical protein
VGDPGYSDGRGRRACVSFQRQRRESDLSVKEESRSTARAKPKAEKELRDSEGCPMLLVKPGVTGAVDSVHS